MRDKGEAVFAATVIRDGQLTVRAIRVGTATTAGQIAALVESAPIGDTRMQNHAEKLADRLVLPTLGLAVGTAAVTGRLQPFPVARDRRLRHRHPRRRADRGAGLDDACGARRHHHQERRAYGAPVASRHRDLRQDRHADPRLAGSGRHHQLRKDHHRPASARACGRGRDQARASGGQRAARQGAGDRRQYSSLRRNQIPHRPRRRRPGQRLLHACRQRALPAPGQYQSRLCAKRPCRARRAGLFLHLRRRRRRCSRVWCPIPTRSGRKAAT